MTPQRVKPFCSSRCCMILLSAWVSARRLWQCSRLQSSTALPTPFCLPADASRCTVP
ncbi:MAG: hypothetical protein ACLR7P_10730 [Faecalibacterium sp.]|nr:hypothetical protein [Faecalibacterium prausnitzii]